MMDARDFLESLTGYVKPAITQDSQAMRQTYFGTINTVSGNTASILFDGESVPSGKFYTALSGYTPVSGDRVTLLATPNSFVILGALAASSGSSGVPTGTVLTGGWAATPTGFLRCDGAAYSRTTEAALFNAIGTQYGAGNGSTTFNVPDQRLAFPRGASGAPGGTGGTDTHSHSLSSNGRALINVNASTPVIVIQRSTAPSWTGNIEFTGSAGSGSTRTQAQGATLNGSTDNATTLPPYVDYMVVIKR